MWEVLFPSRWNHQIKEKAEKCFNNKVKEHIEGNGNVVSLEFSHVYEWTPLRIVFMNLIIVIL